LTNVQNGGPNVVTTRHPKMEMFQDAICHALLVTFGKPLMSRNAWGGWFGNV